MDKINRYLYQVKRYSSGRNKDDIIEELRSLILDELEASEGPASKEERLDVILKEFGHPRVVAAKYSGQGLLIRESLTPIFWMVLRIIVSALPAALVLGTTIDFFMAEGANDFAGFLLHFVEALPGIASSVFAAIGILFLIFYGISKGTTEEDIHKFNTFDPGKLPKVPESQYRFKMVDALFDIIASAILLYVLNYEQGVFAIYENGNIIVFLNESFNAFLIFINIALIGRILLTLSHIYMNKKTFATKTIEFIWTVYSSTITIAIAFSDVLNQTLIDTYTLDFLPTLFTAVLLFVGIVSLIVGAVDYIKAVITIPKENESFK